MTWVIIVWLLLELELRLFTHRWHRCRWVAALRVEAVTIGRHVLYRGTTLSPALALHERAHVAQWRRYTLPGFLLLYGFFQLRYGYAANPLEQEARDFARAFAREG